MSSTTYRPVAAAATAPTGQPMFDPAVPDEGKVLAALSDGHWDFRTVDGIARSTGLSEARVREILDRDRAQVRRSLALGPEDRQLYTLRSRPVGLREAFSAFQSFLKRTF